MGLEMTGSLEGIAPWTCSWGLRDEGYGIRAVVEFRAHPFNQLLIERVFIGHLTCTLLRIQTLSQI